MTSTDPPPLTEAQLAALEEAVAKMTPAPWRECGHDRGGCVCGLVWSLAADCTVAKTAPLDDDHPHGVTKPNAAGISLLRNHAASLLAEVRMLRAELDRAAFCLEECVESLDTECGFDEDPDSRQQRARELARRIRARGGR